MELFDAHCHLQEPELAGELSKVIARARNAGVGDFMCCGTCESDWPRVIEIASAYPGVHVSLGLHPWYVTERTPQWLELLETSLVEHRVEGIGEIGLDHAMENVPAEEQAVVLVSQLRLARRLQLPVSLHCRKAFGALHELLRAEGGLPYGGVLHSYSGPPELVREFESLNLFLSFSGSITRPNNRRGARSLAVVSPERLLIESDAPAMTPEGVSTSVNEPANLRAVLAAVARVRGISQEEVAELTCRNAQRLFGTGGRGKDFPEHEPDTGP